jgi:hypothetical protein
MNILATPCRLDYLGLNSDLQRGDWIEDFPWGNAKPLDYLAATLFLNDPFRERRLIAMFVAYFDASGNAVDQPNVIVTGYIANLPQWEDFEKGWEAIHRAAGVNMPFHMADFMSARTNPKYQYQKNARTDYIEIAKNPDLAEKFLKTLTRIQFTYTLCSISCTVPMAIYGEVGSLLPLRDVVPPYALAARMCIQRVRQWEKDYNIRLPVECIFEEGDFEQGKFTSLMVDEGEPTPIYKKKNDFAGLQGADQFAWETSNFFKQRDRDPQSKPRLEFNMLIDAIPKLHTRPDLAFLINLCHRKGIDPKIGRNK